ncbi:hypothetical protein [Streptomyces bottropensis]|uniref:hypothetical protein n=1 Tax=Streptomyces bottropensis TaxID=42235 RepID=UPI0036D1A1EF
MSTVVEFFLAPDDTAAGAALPAGPRGAYESLSFGNFDPEEAVIEWECLLTGSTFEELVEAGEPRAVADRDDGECVILVLSPRLSAALADARPKALRDVAVAWSGLRAADGEVIDAETAEAIMGDVAALVGGGRRRGLGVYCWVA